MSMMYQVLQDFHGIADYRQLSASEIRCFYERLRPQLEKYAKDNGGNSG